MSTLAIVAVAVALALLLFASAIRIVREYERVVVFRLGRLRGERGVMRIAQTTLRATLGQHELDDLLANQATINGLLEQTIDAATEPWGVRVVKVETKDVDLPDTMKRAMARQAEAERERRAKVIAAEGEFQAAERLSQAAETIGEAPGALTLRTLQTLAEIATEHNSTLVLPIPIDVLDAVRERTHAGSGDGAVAASFGIARTATPRRAAETPR